MQHTEDYYNSADYAGDRDIQDTPTSSILGRVGTIYGSTPYTRTITPHMSLARTIGIGRTITSHTSPISSSESSSETRTDPDYVFLSINPPNGLELSNIAYKSTIDELREQIFPMWPLGIAHEERYGYDWRVKFADSPWNARGHQSIMAQRMICRIFWVLAVQGYVYLTSVNTGRAFKSPRLVFVRAPSDARAYFFTMSLNSAGRRVTFVDPPPAVFHSLGLSDNLRVAFPHLIYSAFSFEDGIFTVTLTSGINAMGAEKDLFLAHILKLINDKVFKLDASVPLARPGLFGVNNLKEIWVFKGYQSWSLIRE